MDGKMIVLSSGQKLVTSDRTDAFGVKKGKVRIFIRCSPKGNQSNGRWFLLCEIPQGKVFPALNFEDQEKVLWSFVVEPADGSAELERIPYAATDRVKQRLLAHAGIPNGEIEGYENSLRSFCMDRALIVLSGNQKLVTSDRTDAFGVKKGKVRIFVSCSKGDPLNGRRFSLCEIPRGKAFPALYFEDSEKILWSFVVEPADDSAELERIPYAATNRVKRRLLEHAGVPNGEIEGYENCIRSFCKVKAFNEDIQIYMDFHMNIPRGNIDIPDPSNYDIVQAYYDADPLKSAFQYICKKVHIPFPDLLSTRPDTSIEEMAEKLHLICRKVKLENGWHRKDCGVLIGSVEETPVALVPSGSSYILFDAKTKQEKAVTSKVAQVLGAFAYLIEPALPNKSLGIKETLSFVWRSVEKKAVVQIALWSLLGMLVGLLLPILNQKVYDEYIPMGDYAMLQTMCMLIGVFVFANITFSLTKKLLEFRVSRCAGYALQDAVFCRIFELPERFFHAFDSGDLTQRLCTFDSVATQIASHLVGAGMSTAFSLIYLIQMVMYSKTLALWSCLLLACFLIISYIISRQTIRYESAAQEQDGKANGKLLQYIEGVSKLRLAGVEYRAISQYVYMFVNKHVSVVRAGRIAALGSELSEAASTVITMVLYYLVVRMIVKDSHQTSIGAFMAFSTAFGSFSGAMNGMVSSLLAYHRLKPTIQRLKPILETVPENETDALKVAPTLDGSIDIENVSFSYSREGKKVLNDVSLTIHPGDYVGIVGESGCGKSTLIKLMLGFVQPTKGRVLYNGLDLSTLNKRTVRQQIGTVLQNGKLLDGTIYENVALGADSPDLEKVNAAIRAAGFEEDVQAMPMGVNTILASANETVSGGQRQRILIARAFCSNSPVLMFDEATSALDNPTQEIVCKGLERTKATRIVIAHRLSTIQHCDRIIVMKDGCIVQQGSYKELMRNKSGMFYQLAQHQLATA